jgi:hypothetical protein
MNRLLLLLSVFLLLAGCATKGTVTKKVKPMVAAQELKSAELLDVSISIFDSKELTEEDKEKLGLSEEIRQAEERFIPIHLKYTMQRSGYWGAVRVLPGESNAHVLVHGSIERSDGEVLSVKIKAMDQRGVKWFDKTYSEVLKPYDYNGIIPEKKDPYQDLYNTIANDLIEHRQKLTATDQLEIQQITELRFAQDMAPDVFSGYLTRDNRGRYSLVRLPAAEDSMLKRVRAVQVRDQMLVDTINGYYDNYYQDLWQSYGDWRKLYSEEITELRKLEKQSWTRGLLGAAAILGGVLIIADGNNNLSRSGLPGVMIAGGAAAIYSGFQKREETKIHRDVIEELSQSFTSEAAPLVLEVVGETVRLNGSAEEQYRKWRSMLRDIYASETGLLSGAGESKSGLDVNSTNNDSSAIQ